MESSIDNLSHQKRRTSGISASYIAGRTRSMQKQLSSSQKSQSSPIERSPEKKLKSGHKTNTPDALSVESEEPACASSSVGVETSTVGVKTPKSKGSREFNVKDVEAANTSRKSVQRDSVQDELSADTRGSKTKGVKYSKLENSSPAKLRKTSPEPESDQLEADDKTNGIESSKKRASKLKVAKELSPKSEPCTDSGVQKSRRKSKLLIDSALNGLKEQDEEKSEAKSSKKESESSPEKSNKKYITRTTAEKPSSKNVLNNSNTYLGEDANESSQKSRSSQSAVVGDKSNVHPRFKNRKVSWDSAPVLKGSSEDKSGSDDVGAPAQRKELKKTGLESSRHSPEKEKKIAPLGNKIVTKKDADKELSKFPVGVQKEKSPVRSTSKTKGYVVESFSSSVKRNSPRNQPNKQNSDPDSDSDAESRKAIMESAQRRIEQSLSTSETDSRYLTKTNHKSVVRKPAEEAGSSDSGSAPENISFESGRKTAMESLKNAVESIQREKQRRKAKRKERLEKLKQQKEEKLIRLKEKLASQEDASCSSSEESGYEEVAYEAKRGKKKRTPKTRTLRTEKENVDGSSVMVLKKTAFSDMDSDDSSSKVTGQVPVSGGLKRLPPDVLDNLPDQIPLKYPKISQDDSNKNKRKKDKAELKDGPEKDFKKPANLDYIPLETEGPTKFGVVPLEKAMKAPKSVSQQAADFRQNMLFGTRISREPVKRARSWWKTLCDYFHQEFAKVEEPRPGPNGEVATRSSWLYFELMSFLRDNATSAGRCSSI